MDALYPNFYSLTSVTSEPLDPRVRRRSLIWGINNTTITATTTTTITTTAPINTINTTNNDTTIITSSNNNNSVNDSTISSKVILPKTFNDNIVIVPTNIPNYNCSQNVQSKNNTGLMIRRRSVSSNPFNRNSSLLLLCNTNDQFIHRNNINNQSPNLTPPSSPQLFIDNHLSTRHTTLTTFPQPILSDLSTISSNNSIKHQRRNHSKISTIACNNDNNNTLSPLRSRRIIHQPIQSITNEKFNYPMTSISMNRNLYHSNHDQIIQERSYINKDEDYSLNQQYKQSCEHHKQIENNQLINNQLINNHRNTYSTPVYSINSNLSIQSAISLQSLNQLNSINQPNQTYSTGNHLITTREYSVTEINNNSLQHCYYQVPLSECQHQYSSAFQRSDSFTKTSSSLLLTTTTTTALPIGNVTFNSITSPIQSNTLHKNRIRPIERRRYTQSGITYQHHNNNELENEMIRLKQQQQQYTIIPQMLKRSSQLSKTHSNVHEQNGICLTYPSIITDLHGDNNRDLPILSNIRRQKPVNSRRAHVVSAFEQSLNNMSQRLQNLSNTTTRKDSELHELRATIDALRNQTELGLLKKPPINRPCELNRSFTNDTLKQQENSCISTNTTTTTSTSTTTIITTNTTSNTGSNSENKQPHINSRLTISNTSLTDLDSQQLQMDNSIDKVSSITSGCKSSGTNVKKNGWFRNSFGKAFRKKTTSSSTLSIHSQSDIDCPTSSIQHNSIYHSNNNNNNNSLPPGHPSNLPQSPTMDHKGLHNTIINQSNMNSIQSNGHMNALSVLSNTHLNGLSPSNSSTLSSSSSSWSTLGMSGNGQNNCNIITATTTTITTTNSSSSSTIVPYTNEQINRLNNVRIQQQQQQQQQQQDHRPIHSNQLSCPNYLVNYNDSDKQNKLFNVEEGDRNILNRNDSKLELNKQSCQDELNHLKCQLAEKESKLTDVQLEALASAHQLDQLKDEMSHLYSQLNYLRTDNERLQILVTHLQKQQHYHHQLQHNTPPPPPPPPTTTTTTTTTTNNNNNNNNNKLLLTNNENVMTSTTTTTITSTPTNTDVHCNSSNNNQSVINTHCNSLPQAIQHNSIVLHNDNNMSILCNTEIIPVECDTCSNLFIGFSERTIHLNNSFIATVNLILNNPQHNNHSSTNSILNIGILYMTKSYNWESINNHLVNLYNLYTSYLNLNDAHNLQMNEFKQYQLHIDSLNYTWNIEFHPNTSNYSIQFNDDNHEKIIQNSQHLINLIQSQSKQFNIQLTINDELLNIEQSNLLADHLNDDQQNLFKQLNNLMIKTLLNRDILYFYYELLYTYHLMIFYDIDDVYMNIVIQAFYEHICSNINSSSLKLHHFNLTDGQQTTINDLYQCLSQYMNNPLNITEQLPSNLIILFYIQSMNQMSNEDYLKIINNFQLYYNGKKDDPNRTCSIYLIGTWITSVDNSSIETLSSSSLPLSSIPSPLRNQTTTSSSMNMKLISYPNKYNSIYKSVQCFNELTCWIQIDYSFKQSYMIGDLKKQLVHSLVNQFNKTVSSSLLNQIDQEYLDKFHNQLKCYEDLIKWIQQVLNYLNQFLIELHNHYHETTLEDPHQFHLINPLIFLSLPFHDDFINSELWFIDLWNNQIVKIIKSVIDQWSNHHQKSIKQPINCIDPTNWILSTWPWHTMNWLECFHKHNNTDMISPPCLIHLIECYT